MPKVSLSNLPVSALFGVTKPSGPTSMSIINDIKQLASQSRLFVEASKLEQVKGKKIPKKGKRSREILKIGQGGTLDPLADGVLVVGIGKGTKKLSEFLDCTKEYQTTCLLGCETDTYDSEGATVRLAPWRHVTRENVESTLSQFTGEIQQTPPIFSALKMDGRPLYEYARKGIPLPRPIEPRQVTVHSLELVEWLGNNHSFRWPEKTMDGDAKQALATALKSVNEGVSLDDNRELDEGEAPQAFVLKMRVSGGTYVRSIVHDLAHALGSAGHVATLSRTRQGRFALHSTAEGDYSCVPWEIFANASSDAGAVDDEGWTEWEREVMQRLELVGA
ncbi:pseudouridine synthase [Pluteus cervinus]|uniref:Pseudouridine synthase n=1 Tax=Pluteus cervinus TaxID=181527 RepID=A0ACD3BF51_9AGAR|nr:pseudouridine synthase [Pluteus cervinus]